MKTITYHNNLFKFNKNSIFIPLNLEDLLNWKCAFYGTVRLGVNQIKYRPLL
jgi:hypothetical protein